METESSIVWIRQAFYGSSDRVIFLPWVGEFGCFIKDWLPYIQAYRAQCKTICCKPGEEIFFPSAADFIFYEKNPIPDFMREHNRYAEYTGEYKLTIDNLIENCKTILKEKIRNLGEENFIFIEPFDWGIEDKDHPLYKVKIPFESPDLNSIHVDYPEVIICCRKRLVRSERNWPYWNDIFNFLKLHNLSFGIAGEEETSYSGGNHHLWNYSPEFRNKILISWLKNCKFVITTDTSIAHLAARMNIPLFLFWLSPMEENKKIVKPQINYIKNTHQGILKICDPNLWDKPNEIIKELSNFLIILNKNPPMISTPFEIKGFAPYKAYRQF